jgi:lipopolysaccharide biosynthesis regulator YciM
MTGNISTDPNNLPDAVLYSVIRNLDETSRIQFARLSPRICSLVENIYQYVDLAPLQRSRVYTKLADVFVEHGNPDRALELLRAALPSSHLTATMSVSNIVRSYLQAGNTQAAYSIGFEVSDMHQRFFVILVIVEFYMKEEGSFETDSLDQALALALTTAKAVPDEHKQFYALLKVLSCHLRMGNVAAESDLLKQMVTLANRFPSQERSLRDIVSTYIQAKKVDRALEVLPQIILNEEKRFEPMLEIIEAYAIQNNVERAIQVAQGITDTQWCSKALLGIVHFECEKNRIEQALELTRNIPDEEIRSSAIKLVSQAYVKAGQLQKGLDIAKNISLNLVRLRAIRDIANAYREAGNVARADELVVIYPLPYEDPYREEIVGNHIIVREEGGWRLVADSAHDVFLS